MLQQTRHFLELIRFSHTVFALPFALLAAVMAWALGAHETPPRGFRWQELSRRVDLHGRGAERGNGF